MCVRPARLDAQGGPTTGNQGGPILLVKPTLDISLARDNFKLDTVIVARMKSGRQRNVVTTTTGTSCHRSNLDSDVHATLRCQGRTYRSRFRPYRRTADVRPVDRLKTSPVPVEFGGDGGSRPFVVRPGPLVGGDGEHVGPLALI